jgi:hypothetical protein
VVVGVAEVTGLISGVIEVVGDTVTGFVEVSITDEGEIMVCG